MCYHPWNVFCMPCGIVSDRPTNVGQHFEPSKMCKLCKSLIREKNLTIGVDPKMGSKLVEAFLPHTAETVKEFNVEWNKWQDACMKEYYKDESDNDDDAKEEDNDSPPSAKDEVGFKTPMDVAELLRKGRQQRICPFNEKLLEYLPMILELKSALKDESGPPIVIVVRLTTRDLCVCGIVSFCLKAVQSHTETCPLT